MHRQPVDPRGRHLRTRPAALLVLAFALLAAGAVFAQEEPTDPEGAPSPEEGIPEDAFIETNPLAIESLESALASLTERARMVQNLILDVSRDYRRAAQRRSEALEQLSGYLSDVDRAAVRPRELNPERLEELVELADQARLRFLAEDRAVERRLGDLRRFIEERDALALRIADIRSRLPQQRELLTGVWEVTWMPAGVSGRFFLDQSGTLVSGQYQLGPLGSGSLQGTFVGGKLYLQRIDAQRGRDAEIEGLVDADGRRLRGTWQAYELVQGGLPQGQWTARRIQ